MHQSKRNKRAAKRLLLKLMKRWGFVPERIPADKLRSYSAAKHEVASSINQSSHKGPNNRAVNSHLPLRKRGRAMQGFRSPSELQRFVSMQSATRNCF
ncbi:DDE-type integrase/transposase/recombinase [Sulfitobacter sp. AS92]|uniref:DDE-type integrase/transposase/recombinase n=1 Tax=Sulfitobacter sp. AS92 TaxID=3135783 RepID=UPI0031738A09